MRVTEFVICEDVRQEIGEKFSLMGVVGPEIRVQGLQPHTPIVLKVGAFIGIDLEEGDAPVAFEFHVRRGGESIFGSAGAIPRSARLPKRVHFAASGNGVRIREPGTLDFLFVLRDIDGNEVLRERKQLVVAIDPPVAQTA